MVASVLGNFKWTISDSLVVIDGVSSEPSTVLSVVPQRTVVTLLILIINDIVEDHSSYM